SEGRTHGAITQRPASPAPRTGSQVPSTARCRSRASLTLESARHARRSARERPPRLRPDASAATPLRSRTAVQTRVRTSPIYPEDHAMLGLHPLSRKAVRLGIAAGSLAAAAACGDNTISGPTLDLNLSRVAGFDRLKPALVKARNENN